MGIEHTVQKISSQEGFHTPSGMTSSSTNEDYYGLGTSEKVRKRKKSQSKNKGTEEEKVENKFTLTLSKPNLRDRNSLHGGKLKKFNCYFESKYRFDLIDERLFLSYKNDINLDVFLDKSVVENVFLFLEPKDFFNVIPCCGLFNRVGNSKNFWDKYLEVYFPKAKKNRMIIADPSCVANPKKEFYELFFPKIIKAQFVEKYLFQDNQKLDTLNLPKKHVFSLLLIGKSSCGKTSLINKFLKRKKKIKPTEGSESSFYWFSDREQETNIYKVETLDTCGKNTWRSFLRHYYESYNEIFLCFAYDDFNSLEYVKIELKRILTIGSKKTIFILGLKNDIPIEERKISINDVDSFLKEYSKQKIITRFVNVSSLMNWNVEFVFHLYCNEILKKLYGYS